MKQLIFFSAIILLLIGCNEKQSKVEVIRLDDNNYLQSSELDNSNEVFSGNYKKNISGQIDKKIKNSGISLDGEFDGYNFRIFVNESGKVDKIIVLKESDEKITNLITGVLSAQTYGTAMKNNKPVKYKFEWDYTSDYKTSATQMPEPIGGISAIQKNIQYPEMARRTGVEGKVYITAFIDESGNVVRTDIIKGIGAGCDKAASEAIKKVKFKPGMQDGTPVKMQIAIPITFRLGDK